MWTPDCIHNYSSDVNKYLLKVDIEDMEDMMEDIETWKKIKSSSSQTPPLSLSLSLSLWNIFVSVCLLVSSELTNPLLFCLKFWLVKYWEPKELSYLCLKGLKLNRWNVTKKTLGSKQSWVPASISSVCLFVCPTITINHLDQFASILIKELGRNTGKFLAWS